MENVRAKKHNITIPEGNEVQPAYNKEKSPVISFNAPEMDVRSPTHEVSVSQANLCSKTCNVN